jgi:hypothetical protein
MAEAAAPGEAEPWAPAPVMQLYRALGRNEARSPGRTEAAPTGSGQPRGTMVRLMPRGPGRTDGGTSAPLLLHFTETNWAVAGQRTEASGPRDNADRELLQRKSPRQAPGASKQGGFTSGRRRGQWPPSGREGRNTGGEPAVTIGFSNKPCRTAVP